MLLAIAISIVSCTDIFDNPVVYAPFDQVLTETEIFTDIKENPDTAAMKKKEKGELDYQSQYSMFITQPVNHDQPDGDKFKQKVCILFRDYDRPTIMVTEGYKWFNFKDIEDIGTNLNANMVHVEHRNFGESFNQDKGKWVYETSAQASADLHAVYQALKPIFKGKWMSTGTSKSGESSMEYAYYYPNDMDLAAAFCSPFNFSLLDKRYGDYLFNEVGTEEERDMMKKGIRTAFENGEEGLYQKVCERIKQKGEAVPVFPTYVYNTISAFYNVFQYSPPSQHKEKLEAILKDEESLVKAIIEEFNFDLTPFVYTYYVECAKEQGFPDFGYDYFPDQLEGTGFKAEDVLKYELHEEDRSLLEQFDNSVSVDMCDNFFMNSTKPLLFFYSHDDPWAAGKPEKIGANAKLVINPIGVHSPQINNPTYCAADVKKEVMDYISSYIY
jgi:hypothetical protein